MKRRKHKRGHYKRIRHDIDVKELNRIFGDKRTHQIIKLVRDICGDDSFYRVYELTDEGLLLEFYLIDFLDEDYNQKRTLYLFDVYFHKYYIRIADGYGMDFTFPTIEDARIGIMTGDIYRMSPEDEKLAALRRKANSKDSKKKSEIVATLAEFRNQLVSKDLQCCIRFDKENDDIVKLEIDQLTVTVAKNGVQLEPIPVTDDNGEIVMVPVTIECEPWVMKPEMLIAQIAELFRLASSARIASAFQS